MQQPALRPRTRRVLGFDATCRQLTKVAARTAVAVALGAAALTVAPGSASAAQARPAQQTAAAPAAVCGYNDNIDGWAQWINCGSYSHLIETWALGVSQSFQCVAAHSTYTLGPTWFISSSKYAGGVGCTP
ncbi:hypothetical protein [Streptomyces sp. NPDC001348]